MVSLLNLKSLKKEIQKIQGSVSRSSIQTNYFDQNLVASTFKVVKFTNGLVFIDNLIDVKIDRFYYFFLGDNFPLLSSISNYFSDFDSVCDVIAKSPINVQLKNFLNTSGFKNYCQLNKMSMNVSSVDLKIAGYNITRAKNKDISGINEIFENNFDRFSERPPNISEIEGAIQNADIYCKFDGFGNIMGFYWCKNMKFLSELRYLFVNEKCRGFGIGKELLSNYFFNTSNINRKQLWVLENNLSAINLYQKYGYEFDGLIDTIFIRNIN